MRVSELAKKIQTSSIEVIKQAGVLGIEAYSPLTQLDAQDVSRLQDHFKQRPAVDVEREQAEQAVRRGEKMALELSRRALLEMILKTRDVLGVKLRQRRIGLDA